MECPESNKRQESQFVKNFSKQTNKKPVNSSSEVACVLSGEEVKGHKQIWMTVTFTFVIGIFLLGGGAFLVFNGAMNNVTDFVVLGSCGCIVGLCFSSVGTIIVFKSFHGRRIHREKKKYITLVQSERNNLLAPNPTNGQARFVSLQKTDKTAKHRPTEKPKTERKKTANKSKDCLIFSKGNVYEHFPTASSSASDDLANNQPAVLRNNGETNENVMIVSKKSNTIYNWGFQNVGLNKSDLVSGTGLQMQSHLTNISTESITSTISGDSCQECQESITVIAEVHAWPGGSRSSLEFSSPVSHEWLDFPHTFLPLSVKLGDEDDVDSTQDLLARDCSSRSDTGVGESISEDDCPFASDDTSFTYMLNTMDNETSNDAFVRLMINDPLVYTRRNEVDTSYILNNCHTITEVLVHSG